MWTKLPTYTNRAEVPSAVINFLGAIVLGVLSGFEHLCTVRPSFLLNVYLFITVIFDIERSRSYALTPQLDLIASIFSTRAGVKVVLAVIEARGKSRLLLPEFADCPPEATSGVYKRALFWWLNDLFKHGYSKSLALNDLFILDKHIRAEYLHEKLGSAWVRCKFQASQYVFLNSSLMPDAWIHSVTKRGPHSLFASTLNTLKWPILAVVPPRLCLIGFNFCQPFLINRAVTFSEEANNYQTTETGYGLIGAYVIVFVGIAVCYPCTLASQLKR